MGASKSIGLIRYQKCFHHLQRASGLYIEGKAHFVERGWNLWFVVEESQSIGAGGKPIVAAVGRDWSLVSSAARRD